MARYIGILGTDVYGITLDECRMGMLSLTTAEAAAAGAVHAAITGTAATASQVITADITSPPYPRNIVATVGGTTADVATCSITITGTNIADAVITEALAFSANATAATAVAGAKAFKTVTSITVPTQDGTGATFAISFADKLGLPFKFAKKPPIWAVDDGIIETTAPTIACSSSALESNTVDINTALDGSVIDIVMVLE